MRRPRLSAALAGTFGAALVVATAPLAVAATDAPPPAESRAAPSPVTKEVPDWVKQVPGAKPGTAEGPAAGKIDQYVPRALRPDAQVTVMLQLAAKPVAVAMADAEASGRKMSPASAQAFRQDLETDQAPVEAAVEKAGGTVLSTTQDAYNGVKVTVAESALEALAAQPNVVAVKPVVSHTVDNEESVPYLGVPDEVWEGLELTGKDVKVGIIDTGIDYTHADFGGPGTPEAFETASEVDDPPPSLFPTTKVVGGYDFAGDDYDASKPAGSPATVPQPDANPIDCEGHGTHVAGTAAGQGVTPDGKTFTGPYGPGAYEDGFKIGPGVAPEADLYALKVFGCEGSTDLSTEAVDWAVANDLDVINLSLGSTFSLRDDVLTDALDNAVRAGIIVAVSAGNDGDSPYILGAPSSAPRAISVAAIDANETFPRAKVTSGGRSLNLRNMNGADLSTPITGPVTVLRDDPATPDADESLGCEASDYDGTASTHVVVNRGVCALVSRGTLGQEAGAASVTIISNVDQEPPFVGDILDVTIPLLGAPGTLKGQAEQFEGRTATITDGGSEANPDYTASASFTSAGPGLAGDLAKPDVAAPGVSIVSASVGTGDGTSTLSGTSMAAPHVAGVAALVRQGHPDASATTLSEAIINTADPSKVAGYLPLRDGAGLVDAAAAITAPVTAGGDAGAARVTFGYLEASKALTVRKTVTLTNTGKNDVSYSADAQAATAGLNARVSVSPSSLLVPAGRSARVSVTVKITPDAGVPTEELQTASGVITFTPTSGKAAEQGLTTLRVPYLAVPRAVSDLRTKARNVGPNAARYSTRNVARVAGTANVHAWQLSDDADQALAVDAGGAPDVRAVGMQSLPGVQPFDDEPAATGLGIAAINSTGRIATAAVTDQEIIIDNDEDGTPDFVVVGVDPGLLSSAPSFTGDFVSATIDARTKQVVRVLSAQGKYNSSTVLLPFVLSDVGIGEGDGRSTDFNYTAQTFTTAGEGSGDSVNAVASFDTAAEPVQTGQLFGVGARSTVDWEAGIDAEQVEATGTKGFLVAELFDAAGEAQAELLPIGG